MVLEGHPEYIGAQDFTNNSAEMSAIVWAAAWALQSQWHGSFILHGDSECAGDISLNLAQTNKHPLLAAISKSLVATASLLATCTWKHIKGHACQPWNELADVVAKAGAAGKLDHGPMLVFPLRPLIEMELSLWGWVPLIARDRWIGADPARPSFDSNGSLVVW